MKVLAGIAICAIVLMVPVAVLAGGSSGFDSVVTTLEHRYHAHATRIPFVGLISLVAHKATTGGVCGLHVAEFDNFNAQVDGDELNNIVAEKLGTGWSRMIRDTSKHGAEQTLIFTRPDGNRMGLFIVDADDHEMDVVQISVDPDHLNQSIDKYKHHDGEGDNADHEDNSGADSD
ncbi:MAG: hypothetical protein WAL75_09850 [Terracidiphilus sp.]